MRALPEPGDLQFRGMSYSHGIMDGEVVRSNKAMGLEDAELRIL
jgi:hypothetical protein